MRWWAIATVCAVIGCADAKPPREQVDLRVQEVRAKIIRGEAGLDEEAARRIESVLDGYQEEQHNRNREVRAARRDLNRLLREDSRDQQAYTQALVRLSKAHEAAHEMRHARFTAIVDNLEPRDAARLLHALGRHHKGPPTHPPGGKGRPGGPPPGHER